MRQYTTLLGLTLLLIAAAACEPAPRQEQPPTVITLLPPIITETPRVTATLPPSDTPTATATSTPSDTPTPITPSPTATMTPTPPVIGSVISQSAARVRAEPANTGEILTTIESGTEVEVHIASEDGKWIFVRFIDVEGGGALVEGWIQANLLDTGTYIPPTMGPSPTPSATFDPNITPSPTPSGTAVTPSARLSDRNVRANCRQTEDPVPSIRAGQSISIWWNWFVARPELMEDHLRNANYEILLDGVLLTNYDQYRTALAREGRDWYVYWYYPVGALAPGRHEVTYRLTWDAAVNDGYTDFGPGTEAESEEGNCVFTISE